MNNGYKIRESRAGKTKAKAKAAAKAAATVASQITHKARATPHDSRLLRGIWVGEGECQEGAGKEGGETGT